MVQLRERVALGRVLVIVLPSHSWEGLGEVGARPQHSSTTAAQRGPGAWVRRTSASEHTETLLLISLVAT